MIAWLSENAERRPRSVMIGFLLIHVVGWFGVAALTFPNLPLDMIEQANWGPAWQIAYFKHPPLPAWVIETAIQLVGRTGWALLALSPLAVALGLYALWRLACRITDPLRALLAVLIQEGVLYFTFLSPEFNHNVIQLPLWPLIAWWFHAAVRDNRAVDWALLGGLAALGMLGKYSTGLLLACLGVYLLAEPTARRRLAGVGPWLTVLVGTLCLAPHVWAVWQSEFSQISFALDRGAAVSGVVGRFGAVVGFSAAQLVDLLPALVLCALLFVARSRDATPPPGLSAPDRRLVATLALGPYLLAMAISLGLGLRFKDMWGAPMWCFVGLAAVTLVPHLAPTRATLRRFAASWLVVYGLGLTALVVHAVPGPWLTGAPLRIHFDGPALARQVETGWADATDGAPLRIVAGSVWLAGNIAFYGRARPAVMIDGDPVKSPWVTPAALAEGGAVLVWRLRGPLDAGIPPAWRDRFPGARLQPPLSVPWRTLTPHPPTQIAWAIVPPA